MYEDEADDKEAEAEQLRLDTVLERVKAARRLSTSSSSMDVQFEQIGDNIPNEFGFWS